MFWIIPNHAQAGHDLELQEWIIKQEKALLTAHPIKEQIQAAHARTHGRVHQPAPDYARHNKRDGHREEEKAAEKRLAAQTLAD